MQLRRGAVAVEAGSNMVRGVYVASVSAVVGTFVPTEAITYTGGGSGYVVRHDTIAAKLYFVRLGGSAPVPGNVIQNGAATKFATISSFASDSTPNFVTELAGPGGPKLFAVPETGTYYSVTTAYFDSLDVSVLYAGTTNLESGYVVIRDFTANFGWPMPAPGDIDLASILTRMAALMDSTLYGAAAISPTLTGNWADGSSSDVRYWKDADRVVHLSGKAINAIDSAPSTVFTLPAGYRPLYTQRRPIIVGTISAGVLEVTSAGVVQVVSGALSVAVYLDGVTFRAEA